MTLVACGHRVRGGAGAKGRALWLAPIATFATILSTVGSTVSMGATPASARTTQTVTSCADTGTGTLRQAIADANSGDIIAFFPTIFGCTITLSSTIRIGEDLTIDGLLR